MCVGKNTSRLANVQAQRVRCGEPQLFQTRAQRSGSRLTGSICIFLRRGRNEVVDDDPAHDRGADTPAAEHGARAERDAVGERGEARYEREHAREDRPARLGAVEKIRAQPEHREKAQIGRASCRERV